MPRAINYNTTMESLVCILKHDNGVVCVCPVRSISPRHAPRHAAREGQFEQARDVLEETPVRINEQGQKMAGQHYTAARADAVDIVQLLLRTVRGMI